MMMMMMMIALFPEFWLKKSQPDPHSHNKHTNGHGRISKQWSLGLMRTLGGFSRMACYEVLNQLMVTLW